jgi:chromosome segregation ATPase
MTDLAARRELVARAERERADDPIVRDLIAVMREIAESHTRLWDEHESPLKKRLRERLIAKRDALVAEIAALRAENEQLRAEFGMARTDAEALRAEVYRLSHAHAAEKATREAMEEVLSLIRRADDLREAYHRLPNDKNRIGEKRSRKSHARDAWLRAFRKAAASARATLAAHAASREE